MKNDKVECAINNKVVASHDKPPLVTAGKLKSTNGVYGIRFEHNTERTMSDVGESADDNVGSCSEQKRIPLRFVIHNS